MSYGVLGLKFVYMGLGRISPSRSRGSGFTRSMMEGEGTGGLGTGELGSGSRAISHVETAQGQQLRVNVCECVRPVTQMGSVDGLDWTLGPGRARRSFLGHEQPKALLVDDGWHRFHRGEADRAESRDVGRRRAQSAERVAVLAPNIVASSAPGALKRARARKRTRASYVAPQRPIIQRTRQARLVCTFRRGGRCGRRRQ